MLLLVVAALTLEATSLVQYYFAKKSIIEIASKRADDNLENSKVDILNILNQVETAIRNDIWMVRSCLPNRDTIWKVTEHVVRENPSVVGSTVALVPGYYEDRELFSPYSFRSSPNGEIIHKTLASEEYDYSSKQWFYEGLKHEDGFWSEPYLDTGGGDIMMTTFSMPVRDYEGKLAAVITADVSLDWLKNVFDDVVIYPGSFGMLFSREGKIMVSPVESLVMHRTLQEMSKQYEDSIAMKHFTNSVLSGENGNLKIRARKRVHRVYYAPIERTGWSMSIVIPNDQIMGEINRHTRIVSLFQFIGLLMLMFILLSAHKNQKKYKKLSENEERMEKELEIARGIQMAMIPKTFLPSPEREDIDVAARIVPAKEVGGDLYDYFIKDRHLYFCIGDVSGKGVPAALVMAMTRSLFRSVAAHENSPSTIVSNINRSLAEMNENNMFVTFFCGILNLDTGHLKYYSLFLYTDGITEAENISHELFGDDRMSKVLSVRRNAATHLEVMEKAIKDFVGDAPQSDDLTMLFIHYIKAKPGYSAHHLVLENDIKQIPRLTEFIEGIIEEKNIDASTAMGINLALEEAVANVMSYAYPEGTVGEVKVDVRIDEREITFMVSDNGKEFDPTTRPEPDLKSGPEERPIGGLGIHLIRTIMDTVSYKRQSGKNLLIMTKNI